jgi:glutamate-1-semialdehyde 2,1-aminomutase
MKTYTESQKLYERAQNVLAGGVSSEFRKFSQPHPLFYERGEGSRIWDADGNEYLDFTLSQGPLILGHSHPHVVDSVRRASETGQLFAGQHLLELELAETLQRLIPCAERLRFALSGSEADHAALRLARAVTGRTKFIRFEGHYHGWLDNAAFGIGGVDEKGDPLPWTEGLPERVFGEAIVLPWNDLDVVEKALEREGDSIAAIITEPVMCNNGCIPPKLGYLEGLRSLCDQYGSLLIFDEVITGFRLSLGGAQEYYKVTPDLAVFGKAMASGYPISVLCGKEVYMRLIAEGRVIHAGTMNSGNPTAAAAMATIEVLEQEEVLPRLSALGHKLMEGLRQAASETGNSLLIQGLGPMFHMGFTSATAIYNLQGMQEFEGPKYARFLRGMQERGIRLIGRGLWYISGAHTEADIDQALTAARETLREMAQEA